MTTASQLKDLIASMQPRLDPEVYVWATAPRVPDGVDPVALLREDEGVTVVLTAAEAKLWGLENTFPSARITLEVHSALDAVGLTAAFATALAEAGISGNVIAGYHHDHIFVPIDRAADAMAALERLSASAAAA